METAGVFDEPAPQTLATAKERGHTGTAKTTTTHQTPQTTTMPLTLSLSFLLHTHKIVLTYAYVKYKMTKNLRY